MKIVQSLWSKPGQKNEATKFSDMNKCGWLDKKYNYYSWALSALQFKKFYEKVELVTDKDGYDLLINRMKLPYTDVKVVLDDLNDYHPDLFALGKVYAYGIQDEPFIHVDADIYIWGKFSEQLEKSSLLCQHKEHGKFHSDFYTGIFMEMASCFDFYPEVLDKSINKYGNIISVNAGIIGGQNYEFFKGYTEKVFEFVNRNIKHLNKIDVRLSNTVFEQFFFHALAEEQGETINYFFEEFVFFWNAIADFTGVPDKIKYIHTCGALKHDKHIVDALEYRLQADYPEVYYNINNLIRTNQI
jgi:hypothetical protein